MRKFRFTITEVITALTIVCLLTSISFGAWDADRITNSTKLKDTPTELTNNFEAIETGTDASLQITNAKVSASAGIADTKLDTITTAGKVNATAITSLSNMPSGAGALPLVNGGTGQTTKEPALNALLPTQTALSGKALITNATTHSWGYPGGVTIASEAQGDLLFRDGSAWTRLGAGTSGQFLKTGGAGANPAWTFNASTLTNMNATSFDVGTMPPARLGSGTPSSANFLRGDSSWVNLAPVTQVNDTDAGTSFEKDAQTTFLSVAKTITSGNTVLVMASGYLKRAESNVTTIRLIQGVTIIQTVKIELTKSVYAPIEYYGWSCVAVVTDLSGSITFSVTAQGDYESSNQSGTAYGNLVVLEF